jgi:class 3 adenylate cyclase
MKTLRDLQQGINAILESAWEQRDGEDIPDSKDIQLGNHAVNLDATVLYADLADSTGLVQGYKNWFAAEVYKSYLMVASELIRNNGGQVTAFDGDRVMGVFIGGRKNSSAAKCALQINHMVQEEIRPRLRKKYATTSFDLKHGIGIDTSPLFIAKTGVWGDNDLVWVGRAANFAAKLCALRTESASIFITGDVYKKLLDTSKFGGNPKQDMWTKSTWAEFGTTIYHSSWRWEP